MLAMMPGASTSVEMRNTAARADIGMRRRGRTIFTMSAMKAGATSKTVVQLNTSRMWRATRL